MFQYLSDRFDGIFTSERVEAVEQVIIYAAVAGLVVHLGVIGAAKMEIGPSRLRDLVGASFLNALYTPFSFLLLYEVFGLIQGPLAVLHLVDRRPVPDHRPDFVRRIFGDIGHLGEVDHWSLGQRVGAIGWRSTWGARWRCFSWSPYFCTWGNTVEQDSSRKTSRRFMPIKKSSRLLVAGLAVVDRRM